MPKRKRGLTTDEIQKVLADLEDEIFDDSDSDCELENEEDDLDQSLNLNPEIEDEVVSEEQKLFQQLHKEYKMNSCGPMRSNRKHYPKKLAFQKMKKGDLSTKFGSVMTAMCWKDKREVFMLSTMDDSEMSKTTLCNDRCEKPALITCYNSNMGFVDLSDRMANSYTLGRKTLKWTKKLFFIY
ncbi:piggyBac transposable element-derived protein 4 [Trichonephila clavipes]|uniref:PiggyBac transposable element-derived protein 4 n=1 Tax=Trichonephila clavipes TaxID=2585209 RepID=A0A8X7B7B5_TRICX|nr:piggyBac transposable element-derived protein 4 [Trichonephila clavipes]